jgi:hypothetical protein
MNLQLGVWDEDSVQPELQPFAQLQALTHLSLDIAKCKGVSTSSSPPVAGCTRLQELHVKAPTPDASTIQGLTGLRRLYVWVPAVEGGADGVAALLSYVGRMQFMERLMLAGESSSAATALGVSDRELGRAVTASGNLEYLDLTGLKLPRSAWVHLFTVGQQLPKLHEFKLCFADISAFGDLFDCSALEQMVACCPAITSLSFQTMGLFKPDVSLAPLLRLQGLADLQCLHVNDGAGTVGVLACMSSLTRLHVCAARGFTNNGLLQLTALQGLQELGVGYGFGPGGEDMPPLKRHFTQ